MTVFPWKRREEGYSHKEGKIRDGLGYFERVFWGEERTLGPLEVKIEREFQGKILLWIINEQGSKNLSCPSTHSSEGPRWSLRKGNSDHIISLYKAFLGGSLFSGTGRYPASRPSSPTHMELSLACLFTPTPLIYHSSFKSRLQVWIEHRHDSRSTLNNLLKDGYQRIMITYVCARTVDHALIDCSGCSEATWEIWCRF